MIYQEPEHTTGPRTTADSGLEQRIKEDVMGYSSKKKKKVLKRMIRSKY